MALPLPINARASQWRRGGDGPCVGEGWGGPGSGTASASAKKCISSFVCPELCALPVGGEYIYYYIFLKVLCRSEGKRSPVVMLTCSISRSFHVAHRIGRALASVSVWAYLVSFEVVYKGGP
eukprot:scaffold171950_cov33-Tisochrysis_lutea.AAC.2